MDSVKAGLQQVDDEAVVFVHDAARPCLEVELIKQLMQTFQEYGNAVPTVDLVDSLRKSNGQESWVDRNDYQSVQTPQAFKAGFLKRALMTNNKIQALDDAQVMEMNGHKIHTVKGNHQNIKVTLPTDLKLAALILSDEG